VGFNFTRSDFRYVGFFYFCTLLFTARVAGQALQKWAPQHWLPPFDAFQGSDLSYGVLLTIQLFILVFMLLVCLRVAQARLEPRRRIGRILLAFGFVYAAGSLARMALGLGISTAPAWFSVWIPATLHIVLAGFILGLALYHLRAHPKVTS
jgi:hypothetical protein